MCHLLRIALGLSLGLYLTASNAGAQMFYPSGYGGYGMSRWGADPTAGYMAGLGAYARGAGVYERETAKADAIKVETMVKWNKALRARQLALREEKEKEAAKREAEREARVARRELEDGTILNHLLFQILDADPTIVKVSRANAPLGPSAIREIPFEWDSEAITVCIDQMTGSESLPSILMDSRFVEERNALRSAVERAIREDAHGSVSPDTAKRITGAVANFRSKFVKTSSDFEASYQDAKDYFTTLASLSRLLNDPSMKKFLALLEDDKERTVGDLIVFMNAYNLRFGATTSERQLQIYRRLVPILTGLRDDVNQDRGPSSIPDRSGTGLWSAAKEAFKRMSWDQLEAHSRER
jgi:hypothetical protein